MRRDAVPADDARTANDGLMLPEQVLGRPPADRQPAPRRREGTRSATPLAWTHAQFVRLAWSIDAGTPRRAPVHRRLPIHRRGSAERRESPQWRSPESTTSSSRRRRAARTRRAGKKSMRAWRRSRSPRACAPLKKSGSRLASAQQPCTSNSRPEFSRSRKVAPGALISTRNAAGAGRAADQSRQRGDLGPRDPRDAPFSMSPTRGTNRDRRELAAQELQGLAAMPERGSSSSRAARAAVRGGGRIPTPVTSRSSSTATPSTSAATPSDRAAAGRRRGRLRPDHLGHGAVRGRARAGHRRRAPHRRPDLVVNLARAETPGLPTVMIGHSMGGLIATRTRRRTPASSTRSCSRARHRREPDIAALLELDPIPDVPIDPAVLSRDPAVGEAYVADPLVYNGPFRRETLPSCSPVSRRSRKGTSASLPVLWIHGEEDALVPYGPTPGRRSSTYAARLPRRRSTPAPATRSSTRPTATRSSTTWSRSSAALALTREAAAR